MKKHVLSFLSEEIIMEYIRFIEGGAYHKVPFLHLISYKMHFTSYGVVIIFMKRYSYLREIKKDKVKNMRIKILKIDRSEPEEIEIRCHEETEEVRDIVTFVKSRQGKLNGISDGEKYEIPVADVYYVEAVDNAVFIYGQEKVYESKQKLYELEGILKEKYFLRVSKSLILNLMKIKAIKPALNGRYSAILQSGEEVIISRKYVVQLKRALKGDIF